MSFSRSQFPNGGWQYHQPQTNWDAPTPKSSTFDQTVNLIIKHRLANGAIRVQHNLSVDPGVVGNELEAFTRARLGIQDPSPPKQEPPQPLAQAVAGVVAVVAKVFEGAVTLLTWEVEGLRPVESKTAHARAQICAECPKNDPSDLTRWFTVPVSETVRKRFERLHELKMETKHDDRLGTCSACLCPLKLKVWEPVKLVLDRLKPAMRDELHPKCWILKLQHE